MVKSEEIGKVYYSKLLDRNVKIVEGPTDDYYKMIGLACVVDISVEVKKDKMTFPKHKKNDSDN